MEKPNRWLPYNRRNTCGHWTDSRHTRGTLYKRTQRPVETQHACLSHKVTTG